MKLRTLLFCIAAALALTLCASAADVVKSGKCGDNLTYTLDSDGVLTISGAGAMDNWKYLDYGPWYEKRDNIVSAVVTNGVTNIGEFAFSYCANLTSVTIPDGVTSIGDSAFARCESLTSVTIPDSVTSVGDCAFIGCKSLTSVTIPDSVTSIGGEAFWGCASLTGVTIPNSVTRINSGTFMGCRSLTSVTIPNGVTFIGANAFSVCASITNVTIPDSVTFIGEMAFCPCSSLTAILVDSDNQNYMSESGILFNKNLSTLVAYPAGKAGAYAIPDSVTFIDTAAFSGCKNLTSVTIPKSVTNIGLLAFYECENLTDVYYDGSAAQWSEIRISDYANGNDALKNANIHYNAQDIGIGITLTDKNGDTIDANGQTGETEGTKKDAFQDGAELTAHAKVVDADAVTRSELVTANVFLAFYDSDGRFVHVESWEIDLSDPSNIFFEKGMRVPDGAKSLKFLIVSDTGEPLRMAGLILSALNIPPAL